MKMRDAEAACLKEHGREAYRETYLTAAEASRDVSDAKQPPGAVDAQPDRTAEVSKEFNNMLTVIVGGV